MKYFDKFPKIAYDIWQDGQTKKILFTNYLIRLRMLETVKTRSLAYYEYTVKDEDGTIEMLAERYYGNPEYHWIIALANDMTDPLFDWPKEYYSFEKYIIDKYGSIATAQTTVHHRNKITTRTSQGIDNVIVQEIDEETYDDLPTYSYIAFDFNGYTVTEIITTEEIDCYTWEDEQNEARRVIKLINRDFVPQLESEFNRIMTESGNSNIRRGMKSLR